MTNPLYGKAAAQATRPDPLFRNLLEGLEEPRPPQHHLQACVEASEHLHRAPRDVNNANAVAEKIMSFLEDNMTEGLQRLKIQAAATNVYNARGLATSVRQRAKVVLEQVVRARALIDADWLGEVMVSQGLTLQHGIYRSCVVGDTTHLVVDGKLFCKRVGGKASELGESYFNQIDCKRCLKKYYRSGSQKSEEPKPLNHGIGDIINSLDYEVPQHFVIEGQVTSETMDACVEEQVAHLLTHAFTHFATKCCPDTILAAEKPNPKDLWPQVLPHIISYQNAPTSMAQTDTINQLKILLNPAALMMDSNV